MRVVLVGAELEENIGLRYMASALEANGHAADIVPFNAEARHCRNGPAGAGARSRTSSACRWSSRAAAGSSAVWPPPARRGLHAAT